MSFHNWYKSIYPLILEADVFKLVESAWEQSAKEEREACAEICDEKHWDWSFGSPKEESSTSGPKECAELIRQRAAQKAEVSE